MALATFVLYYNNLGTSTARPVFQTFEEDDTFTPDLAELGYGSDVAWGRITATDPLAEIDDDDETTTLELRVNPSTLSTAPATATTPLAERQRAMRSTLDQLIFDTDWTQATDSRLTLASRNAFKAYRDELAGISDASSAHYQATWATDPFAVVRPTAPTPAYTTTDLGHRTAELMGDGTLGRTKVTDNAMNVDKQAIWDRETQCPEFTFDNEDLTEFGVENCVPGFTKTGNRSGGAAIFFSRNPTTTALAEIRSKLINYVAVNEKEIYVLSLLARSHTSTAYAGGLELRIAWFAEDKVTVIGGGSVLIATRNLPTDWDHADALLASQPVTPPVGARYARLILRIPATAPAGTEARIDGLTMRKAIDGDFLKAGTVALNRLKQQGAGHLLGRAAGAGTGDVTALTKTQVQELLSPWLLSQLNTAGAVRGDYMTFDINTGSWEPRYPGFDVIGPWYYFDPAGTSSAYDGLMPMWGGGNTWRVPNRQIRMHRAGRIVGSRLAMSTARTGGTCTVRPVKNNTMGSLSNPAQINSSFTFTAGNGMTYENGYGFLANDIILMAFDYSSYAPQLHAVAGWFIVQYSET